MTSSYNDIYSRFLNKIRDYEFAGLPEPNATEKMREWLQSVLSKSETKHAKRHAFFILLLYLL